MLISDPQLGTTAASRPPAGRIMLFTTSDDGHFPAYIRHLCAYWQQQGNTEPLQVVSSPRLVQRYAAMGDGHLPSDDFVQFTAMAASELDPLVPRKSPIHRAFRAVQEWHLFCDYARRLQVAHTLLLYFDSFQTPLALGLQAPCSVSGIYFRPTLHYRQFSHHHATVKERIQWGRERAILPRVLRHPQLQRVFCLDPFAIPGLNRMARRPKAIPLADPVAPDPIATWGMTPDQVAQLRKQLGIGPERQVLLLFGALDQRKGIHQLLDALTRLSDQHCQQICLLLLGEVAAAEREILQAKIHDLQQTRPLQICCRDGFVSDREVQLHFQLADLVLAPYQRHVGMSGILLLAAAAQKPVLSSHYGLMGELVQRYQLGLGCDSTDPQAIAAALTQWLQRPGQWGDRTQMQAFALRNSTEAFASTIFQHLVG